MTTAKRRVTKTQTSEFNIMLLVKIIGAAVAAYPFLTIIIKVGV